MLHDFLDLFFIQQTRAYWMRISDWSSVVCSSDLGVVVVTTGEHRDEQGHHDDAAEQQPEGAGLAGPLAAAVGRTLLLEASHAARVLSLSLLAGHEAET